MQIYKVVNMLAALNDTNRLASDMYELGKSLYFCETKQEYIPISQMDFQHMERAFKKAIKEVEELKEDLYDNQVKIKELCKEGDKLESKIKKLKVLLWNEKQATKAEDIVLSREIFVKELNKSWYLRRDNILNEIPDTILDLKENFRKKLNDFNLEIWCMKQLESENFHELIFDKGEWPIED